MSRSRRSIKREIRSINKAMELRQWETGQTIVWYQFDAVHSARDPVYDEGPAGRVYKAGLPVPVQFAYFEEAPQLPDPETGFYLVNTVHFTVSIDLLRKSGILNPEDTATHFHDRFSFNGNLYDIDRYEKQGLVHNTWLTIGVDGHQVKDDEDVTNTG